MLEREQKKEQERIEKERLRRLMVSFIKRRACQEIVEEFTCILGRG